MKVFDFASTPGIRYPAGRTTRNISGGSSPLASTGFCSGIVTLDPDGGQVPWHSHTQEELYMFLSGSAEACVGTECSPVHAGQALLVPSGTYHQLTNTAPEPATFIYVYSPGGEVGHWRQELAGTLPRPGDGAPPLPPGASSAKA